MRHTTDALFQAVEALRRRVETLEGVVEIFERELRRANNDKVALVKQLKELEDALGSKGRDEIHEEGQEQGR